MDTIKNSYIFITRKLEAVRSFLTWEVVQLIAQLEMLVSEWKVALKSSRRFPNEAETKLLITGNCFMVILAYSLQV